MTLAGELLALFIIAAVAAWRATAGGEEARRIKHVETDVEGVPKRGG